MIDDYSTMVLTARCPQCKEDISLATRYSLAFLKEASQKVREQAFIEQGNHLFAEIAYQCPKQDCPYKDGE